MVDKAISLGEEGDRARDKIGTREQGDDPGLRSLLADGLHFTGVGYKVFLDQVRPEIGKTWKGGPVGSRSWIWPHWSIAPKLEHCNE